MRSFDEHNRRDKSKLYRLLYDAAQPDRNGDLRRKYPFLRRLNDPNPVTFVSGCFNVPEADATRILKTLHTLSWIEQIRGFDDIRLLVDPTTLERPQLVKKDAEKPTRTGPSLQRAYKYLATRGKLIDPSSPSMQVASPARKLMGKFQTSEEVADELLRELHAAGCILIREKDPFITLIRPPADNAEDSMEEPSPRDEPLTKEEMPEVSEPAIAQTPAEQTAQGRRGVGRRSHELIELANELTTTRLAELYAILWAHRDPNNTIAEAHQFLWKHAPECCLTHSESVYAIGQMATLSRKWLSIPKSMDGNVVLLIDPREIRDKKADLPPIEIVTKKRASALARKVYTALETYVSRAKLAETGKRFVFTPIGSMANALEMHGERKQQLNEPFDELATLGCIIWHERKMTRRDKRTTVERYVELVHAPNDVPTPASPTPKPKPAPTEEDAARIAESVSELRREFGQRLSELQREFEMKMEQLLARLRVR